MATFAQIQAEIESMLSIPDNMLTDEQRATMDAYLDELGQQEADKVDGFGQFLRLQTARAEAMKEEAKRLSAAAKCIENRLERLKLYYVGVLRVSGLQRVSGKVYTLSTRKSERVEVPVNVSGLGEAFVRRKVTIEPDKKAICDAIKSGQEVPGCRIVESYSLQVK